MLFPGLAAGAGIEPGWILGYPWGVLAALVGRPDISDGGFRPALLRPPANLKASHATTASEITGLGEGREREPPMLPQLSEARGG